jgi:hypothetical protein
MNLYQRINEVRKAITYVKKDKTVSTGQGGGYKAVTHDQVTGMVREHMVKHGIVSYPVLVDSLSNPKEVNAQMETAKQFRYEATYDIVFVNAEDPADTLTIRIQAHAMDNADKAPGKALSYAKKYAILKLFEIETGEDEESRYQDKEEFNLEVWAQLIEDSTDVAGLEKNYLEAKAACLKVGDSSAMKGLNAVTVARKKELSPT